MLLFITVIRNQEILSGDENSTTKELMIRVPRYANLMPL